MSEKDLRAHDLAVAFAKDLHQDMSKRLDQNTLEFLLKAFAADYETAYEYFRENIN